MMGMVNYALKGRDSTGLPVCIPLADGRVTVGRHGDIRLMHESVSRNHAVLERRAEGWLLIDLGSRNGTTVNGISIVRHLLVEGDRVGFGKVRMTVERMAAEPPSAVRQVPDDDDGDLDAPTGMIGPTTLFSAAGGEEYGALGVLRRLAQGRYDSAKAAFAGVAEDLAGVRGVSWVQLEIDRRAFGTSEDLVSATGRMTPRYAREAMRAKTGAARARGQPVRLHGGMEVDDGAACDALAMPLMAADQCRGTVWIEAEGLLAADQVQSVCSLVSGIELGLGMWISIGAVVAGRMRVPAASGPTPVMVGRSAALQSVVQTATMAAKSDATVLIYGESGTGKELFARLIYDESERRERKFLAVHCSAIESTLLGSTLFGHEKGAFTGAVTQKKGLFEECDGGTIFLDEIGELSHDMQVKLLRVLQEGEFMRVGGTETIHVDVRVVCATNRNLAEAVREGKFREDLYYRLNVIELDLPPLRKRAGDVRDLVLHFASTLSRGGRKISDAAMAALCAFPWPGNVRQLRNFMERTLVLSRNEEIQLEDLPYEVREAAKPAPAKPAEADHAQGHDSTCDTSPDDGTAEGLTLEEMERRHVLKTLEKCAHNVSQTAERLGISRSTLHAKLAKWGVAS